MSRDLQWRGVVAGVERAATPKGRRNLGCFSLEGTRLHERALRAGVRVERAVVAESFREDRSPRIRRLLSDLESSGCSLHMAPEDVVQRLTAGRSIGAILGLARLPVAPKLEDVLASATARPASILVGLDIEEPGNVGALVRTALALGASAFVGVGLTDAFHPKAVRTSMGSLFKLPLLHYAELEPLLAELSALRVRKVGGTTAGGTPLPRESFDERAVAAFIGGEAFGFSGRAAAAMDRLVTIPMATEIDSLSVNAAAAVLLYEIRRRAIESTR